MKVLKRNLSVLICLATLLSLALFGILLITYSNSNKRALAATTAAVTVKMYNGGEGVSIGGVPVALEGSEASGFLEQTQDVSTVSEVALSVTPKPRYEIDRIECSDASTTITAHPVTPNSFTLVIPDTTDALEIKIFFKLTAYKVNIEAVDLRDTGADLSEHIGPTGFFVENITNPNQSQDEQREFRLGDEISAYSWNELLNGSGTAGLRFSHYEVENGTPSPTVYSVGQTTINEEFLATHVDFEDEITIKACYYNIYKVNVLCDFMGSDELNVSIETERPNGIDRVYGKDEIETFNEMLFEEGTVIVITPKVDETARKSYKFNGFKVEEIPVAGENYIINSLDEALNINVAFAKIKHTLFFVGEDKKGAPVSLAAATLSQSGMEVELDDILAGFDFPDVYTIGSDTYELLGFSIRNAGGSGSGSFVPGMEVDNDFLNAYSSSSSAIVIYVDLIKLYSVTVSNPLSTMGSYKIEFYDTVQGKFVDAEGKTMFRHLTSVRVIVQPKNIYYVSTNNFLNNTVEFPPLDNDAQITLGFKPDTFDLTTNNPSVKNGSVSVSETTGLQVDKFIYISCDVKSGYEIKSFKVNDSSFKRLPAGSSYANGTITLKLTADWLANNNFDIEIKVETGMKTGVVLAFVLPSVGIAAFIALFVCFMIINAKRKKVIKAELTDKLRTEVTMNASKFISDLREGKDVGRVTEADIKKEMKNKKKK